MGRRTTGLRIVMSIHQAGSQREENLIMDQERKLNPEQDSAVKLLEGVCKFDRYENYDYWNCKHGFLVTDLLLFNLNNRDLGIYIRGGHEGYRQVYDETHPSS